MDNNVKKIDGNVRTMEFVCEDDWNMLVYKCQETNILYKCESFDDGEEPTQLYSCSNEIDGEPCFPIDKNLKIHFIKTNRPTETERFNYQMLGRLKSDCDYYLGNGNKYAGHLWAGNEKDQIKEMKKIYNSFSDDKKPEWLTYEAILQYEELMINN